MPAPTATRDLFARRARAARRRAAGAVLVTAGLPMLVVAVVIGSLVSWAVGGPLFAVGTALGAMWLWHRAPAVALAPLGAAPLGEGDRPSARMHNLVESLCAVSGVPRPVLMVVEEAAPNALVLGMSEATATLVVTRGLLSGLSRLELEAVVAHELSHIRCGDCLLHTVAAVTIGPLASLAPGIAERVAGWLLGSDEVSVDQAAVSITRFPPALSAALEKMATSRLPGRSLRVDVLWDVPPAPSRPPAGGVEPVGSLTGRIEALREL